VQKTARVVVDLSQVQFIDSAGCGVLLQFHKRLQEEGRWAGGLLHLAAGAGPVRAGGFSAALDIYPSRQAAVKALQA